MAKQYYLRSGEGSFTTSLDIRKIHQNCHKPIMATAWLRFIVIIVTFVHLILQNLHTLSKIWRTLKISISQHTECRFTQNYKRVDHDHVNQVVPFGRKLHTDILSSIVETIVSFIRMIRYIIRLKPYFNLKAELSMRKKDSKFRLSNYADMLTSMIYYCRL